MKQLLILLLLSNAAYAQIDTSTEIPSLAPKSKGVGNGGDLVKIKAARLASEILFLSDALVDAVNFVLPEMLKSQGARELYGRIQKQELIDDIKKSGPKYVIKTQCLDKTGKEQSATAIMGDLGGEICFSPIHLAQAGATPFELLGIALHEHIHHLGFDESDELDALTLDFADVLALKQNNPYALLKHSIPHKALVTWLSFFNAIDFNLTFIEVMKTKLSDLKYSGNLYRTPRCRDQYDALGYSLATMLPSGFKKSFRGLVYKNEDYNKLIARTIRNNPDKDIAWLAGTIWGFYIWD